MRISLQLSWLVAAGFAVAAPSVARAADPVVVNGEPTVKVTARDVALTNEKTAQAHAALVAMWSDQFADVGERFVAPRLMRYRGGAIRTACGVIAPSNANYCPNDNTIYFDDVFVTEQAKRAAETLGTDGDMTAVGIIAHEMGHAVSMQLGYRPRSSYENEAAADCLAGSFARQAQADGSLESGDLEEAMYGMAAAGDPELQLTGNARRDARMERRYQRVAHGTPEQRVANFRRGLYGGAGSCLPALQ